MLERMGRCLFSVLLVVALAASLIGAAAENAQVMEEVRRLAWPYYEASIRIAAMSTDLGRDFTDHKTAHAEMVAESRLRSAMPSRKPWQWARWAAKTGKGAWL